MYEECAERKWVRFKVFIQAIYEIANRLIMVVINYLLYLVIFAFTL